MWTGYHLTELSITYMVPELSTQYILELVLMSIIGHTYKYRLTTIRVKLPSVAMDWITCILKTLFDLLLLH